jgi:hypothetical protein
VGCKWPEYKARSLSQLVFLRSVRRLLVTASIVPSSILVTLMKEALSSSETSVLQESHGVISQKKPFFNILKVRITSSRQTNREHRSCGFSYVFYTGSLVAVLNTKWSLVIYPITTKQVRDHTGSQMLLTHSNQRRRKAP